MRDFGASSALTTGNRALVAAGWSGLLLLTLPDNSATRVFTWPWFGLAALVWLAPLLLLSFRSFRRELVLPARNPIVWGTVLFVFAIVVAAVTSPLRGQSLALMGPYLAPLAFLLVLCSDLYRRSDERVTELLLGLVAVGAGLVVLGSVFRWIVVEVSPLVRSHGLHWAELPRNEFPFGHSIYAGGFSAATIPWLIIAGLYFRRARLHWFGLAGAALVVVIGSSSRGAVLSLAVILAVSGVYIWRTARSSAPIRRVLVTSLVAICGLFLVSNPRIRGLLLHGRWSEVASQSNDQRASMLAVGARMGRDRPWTGWGPGTVPSVYPRYRESVEGGIDSVLELHNTPVQLWAEFGVLGFLAGAAVLGGSLLSLASILREQKQLSDAVQAVQLASALSAVAMIAMSLTDFFIDVPAIGALGAVNLGVLAARRRPGEPLAAREDSPRWYIPVSLSLGLIVAGPLFLHTRSRQLSDQAFDRLARGDFAGFESLSERAFQTSRWDPVYLNQIAAEYLRRAEQAREPGDATTSYRKAAALFERSATVDAWQEYVQFNLGWLHLRLAEGSALSNFSRAAQASPEKGGVYLGWALAFLATDSNDQAVRALALETLNDPAFWCSGWWTVPELTELRPKVYRALLGTLEELSARYPSSRELTYFNRLMRWSAGELSAAQVADFTSTPQRRAFFQQTRPPQIEKSSNIQTSFRRRLGYSVVTRHPDLPPPVDLFPIQEHEGFSGRYGFLFPAKGWLGAGLMRECAKSLAAPSR